MISVLEYGSDSSGLVVLLSEIGSTEFMYKELCAIGVNQ